MKKNQGYILLTLLFLVVSVSSIFFVSEAKHPKKNLNATLIYYKNLTELERLTIYYISANLSTPSLSNLESDLIVNNDIEFNVNHFSIPSSTPSLNLSSLIPLQIATIKIENESINVDRNYLIKLLSKRLTLIQSLSSNSNNSNNEVD